jgi:branched-subunit amino acid transport protein AzlD
MIHKLFFWMLVLYCIFDRNDLLQMQFEINGEMYINIYAGLFEYTIYIFNYDEYRTYKYTNPIISSTTRIVHHSALYKDDIISINENIIKQCIFLIQFILASHYILLWAYYIVNSQRNRYIIKYIYRIFSTILFVSCLNINSIESVKIANGFIYIFIYSFISCF